MKQISCIKDKCKYYKKDKFMSSWKRCLLRDYAMAHDTSYYCIIDKHIEELEARVKHLKESRTKIKDGELN